MQHGFTGQQVAVDARLRVVIGDHDAAARQLTVQALERASVEVCAETESAHDTINAVTEHRPDVVLIDVRMPGNGLRAAWEIGEVAPETKVVILTALADDADIFDALQAGAVGYLLKDGDLAHLPDTLAATLRGELALPRSLVARVVSEFRERGRHRHLPVGGQRSERLSEREWEVLELLAQSKSTAEIAEQLFVSAATVRTHVAAILRKLKVPDRASAIRLMRER